MTNFNFLSKSSSQSCGHSSVTLASTVGSPSAHHRGTMLKHLTFLLLFLFVGIGNAWGTGATLDYKDMYSSTISLDGVAKSADANVTITLDKGDGSTAPSYYTTGNGARTYGSNTITVDAGSGTITQIDFTFSKNDKDYSVNTGTYTKDNARWTGSASSVVFTTASGSGHNRIQMIKVTYTAGGSTKTLSSIALSGDLTKSAYVVGESFSPAGLTVTAQYSDKTSADVTNAATWTPTGALTVGTGKTMTASYTEGGTTKTATTNINVYDVTTLQARDEDGNTIAAGGPGAPTRSGTTITAAADAGNYVFKQWDVTNASVAASETTPTTISDPTDAVTVTAVYYKPIPVSWNKNGSLYETTYTGYNQKPVFPDVEPSSCDATSNTFYGWATSTWDNTVDNLAGKTVYTSASSMPNVTATGVVYNAVFAKATDTSSPADVTSTFTSKAWADAANSWSSDDDGDELTSGRGVKVMKSGAGGGTADGTAAATTVSSYNSVTSVVVTYSTNSSSGAGSINITVGGTSMTASASITTTGGTSDRTITYMPNSPATNLTGKVKIAVSCTTSSIYVKSVQINYRTGSVTYSKYLTTCCTPLGSINGSFS